MNAIGNRSMAVQLGSGERAQLRHIKQDTTHLGLYGQTNWNKLSADWSAAYGRSESKVNGSDWKPGAERPVERERELLGRGCGECERAQRERGRDV